MLGIGTPSPTELLIVLAIVLVIFGPSKLKGLGKGLGTTLREFRDSMSAKDDPAPPAEAKPHEPAASKSDAAPAVEAKPHEPAASKSDPDG